MNWADSVKATALATLAERTTPTARTAADTPWSWNAHDVWLSRVKPLRDLAAQPSESRPTPSRQSTCEGRAPEVAERRGIE